MASILDVSVRGAREMQRKLRADRLIDPPLRETLRTAATFTEAAARRNAPRDTGALARSIVSEVHATAARVYTPLAYAETMELGRRPGGPMPPLAALTGWARRHGFAPGSEYVLARAIARRGIRGRFFMRQAAQRLQAELPRLLGEMGKRIEVIWRS